MRAPALVEGDPFYAGLVAVDGLLYGAAQTGGGPGGCVFSIDPRTGSEKLLYSFLGRPDGRKPNSILINVGLKLYGMTVAGGKSDRGTVFSVNRLTGVEVVLHSFGTGSKDGQYPAARLLHVGSDFYGTTQEGGAHGEGTVFRVQQ